MAGNVTRGPSEAQAIGDPAKRVRGLSTSVQFAHDVVPHHLSERRATAACGGRCTELDTPHASLPARDGSIQPPITREKAQCQSSPARSGASDLPTLTKPGVRNAIRIRAPTYRPDACVQDVLEVPVAAVQNGATE